MQTKDIRQIDFYDGKKRVLILGNGISRIYFPKVTEIWQDEIWACNWAYQEYLDGSLPRLDLLIGDYICLKKVIRHKGVDLKGVKILGKSERSLELEEVQRPNSSKKYYNDSGSTAVVHALNEGYDEIYLLGFDLGGADIYQQNHHLRNKKMWLRNWRTIERDYGLDKVFFIGFDHKKIIKSPYPDDVYSLKYMRGQDHLDGEYDNLIRKEYGVKKEFSQNVKKKSVLIIGNGKTRLREPIKKFIRNWKKEMWGCNRVFNERNKVYRLNRIAIDYEDVLQEALDLKDSDKNINFDIISNLDNQDVKPYDAPEHFFTAQKLIVQALTEGYNDINLAGIDFSDKNIYNVKDDNWKLFLKQTRDIIREFGLHKIKFAGGTPKFLK